MTEAMGLWRLQRRFVRLGLPLFCSGLLPPIVAFVVTSDMHPSSCRMIVPLLAYAAGGLVAFAGFCLLMIAVVAAIILRVEYTRRGDAWRRRQPPPDDLPYR